MCGIAGVLGGQPSDLALRTLGNALAHRGPDGEGFYFDQAAGIGLAHRRLAIIDLTEAAAQPMASCNGRYRVVFNGEIYNFRAIADDLAQHGYIFNRESDTAILGPLYDRYGIEGLHRLNGIFAFALWDAAKRELIVARDAFGVKPLYYARRGGSFAFASELKALAALGFCGSALNEAALLDYLVHLWSPGPATLSANVHKLLPGHVIRIRPGQFELGQWYTPAIGGGFAGDREKPDPIESVRTAFDNAVAAQCLSDVPIGAFLSGGVDSSAIVASMVASGNPPCRTYCIGFTGPSMVEEGFGDDLSYARLMARRLHLPLTEVRVGEVDVSDVERLPFLLDEPEADPAALYVSKIAEAARAEGIKVLLSGTGGDDIFSGYRRHRAAALRARAGYLPKIMLSRVPTGVVTSGPFKRRLEKLKYLFEGDEEDFLLRAFEFNPRDSAVACLAPEVVDRARDSETTGWLKSQLGASASRPLVDRMLHLELMGFLPDHNLNYTDKAAMAHGVEVRVPFLDPHLVACAAQISWRLKTRPFSEKWVLKRALSDRLPSAVLNRKKTGFGAPVRSWFSHGKLKTYAADIVASRTFRDRGLFNAAAVEALLRDTTTGARDGSYLLFAIIVIEQWLRQFADRAKLAEQSELTRA
jgi:asparagine synthase (glutamine-hydrolysing)